MFLIVLYYSPAEAMRILMVCLGNICRSPMAEGIFRKKAEENNFMLYIDSAGTGDWHAGENPDPRAIKTAHRHGVNISELIARQFTEDDFDNFDKIFAMDMSNYKNIIALARNETDRNKVTLFLEIFPDIKDKNVPDPWYGDEHSFTNVFRLLEEASEEWLKKLK